LDEFVDGLIAKICAQGMAVEDLIDQLTKYREKILEDAAAGNPDAQSIIGWYNAWRKSPRDPGSQVVCWGYFDDWKRSKEEKPVSKELARIEAAADLKIAPMAADALSFAHEVEIVDNEVYQIVADWLTGTQAIRKEIENSFDPTIEANKHALDVARAAKNRYSKPLEDAVKIAKGKMGAFIEQQEIIKREQDRKLREEAQKKAEEEQKAKALALAKAGKQEAASKLALMPVRAAPVVNETPAVPKVDGIAILHEFEYTIVDPELIPNEYRIIDESKIRKVVAALGDAAIIPGVEIRRKVNIAAGAR
jgi:hypothetical protein